MPGPEHRPGIEIPTILNTPITSDGKRQRLHEAHTLTVGRYLTWSRGIQWSGQDKPLMEQVASLKDQVPDAVLAQTEGIYLVENNLRFYRGAAKAEIGDIQPYDDLYFDKKGGWVFTESRHVTRARHLLLAQGIPEERIAYLDRIREEYPWRPEDHGLDSAETTLAYAGWQEKRTRDNYETLQSEYDAAYSRTKDERFVPRDYPGQKIGGDLALEAPKLDEGGHHEVFAEMTLANIHYFPERMSDVLRHIFGGNNQRMPVVFHLPRDLQVHFIKAFKVDSRFGPENELETSVKPYLVKLGAQKEFPEYFPPPKKAA